MTSTKGIKWENGQLISTREENQCQMTYNDVSIGYIISTKCAMSKLIARAVQVEEKRRGHLESVLKSTSLTVA